MAKIRRLRDRTPSRPWIFWPRVGLALAATAAVALVVVGTLNRPSHMKLAKQIEEEFELFAALGEPLSVAGDEELDMTVKVLQEFDMLIAAKPAKGEESRREPKPVLRKEGDDELLDQDLDSLSDDDLLEELKLLDDLEISIDS